MATAIIKRKEFKAQLPSDLCAIRTLTRIGNGKQVACTTYPRMYPHYEYYMIREDWMYFSGRYSTNRIVRWVQKFKESVMPIKYKVDYISLTEYNKLNNK